MSLRRILFNRKVMKQNSRELELIECDGIRDRSLIKNDKTHRALWKLRVISVNPPKRSRQPYLAL